MAGWRKVSKHALFGLVLASTAVEKFIKAFLSSRNQQAFGHLNDWSTAGITRIASELSLNSDFLALLQKVYRIRYIDDLKSTVSFSIERSKFLAELDRTAVVLNSAVEFKRGGERINPYEAGRAAARSELLENNIAASGHSVHEHLQKPDIAEAFYIDSSLEIISCVVNGWVPTDHSQFTAPGIIRVGNEYQCQLVVTAA